MKIVYTVLQCMKANETSIKLLTLTLFIFVTSAYLAKNPTAHTTSFEEFVQHILKVLLHIFAPKHTILSIAVHLVLLVEVDQYGAFFSSIYL